MKNQKIALTVIGALGLLFILTTGVWAGAGQGGFAACCVVTNPGGGALALKGTWALELIPSEESPAGAFIDVKVRLERAGQFAFLDLTLDENLGGFIAGLDNDETACLLLNPNSANQYPVEPPDTSETSDRVIAFVDQILSTFFPDKGMTAVNTALVITRGSVTFTDGPAGSPVSPYPGVENPPVPDTDRKSSIGDITIYAIDKENAKYEPDSDAQCIDNRP